MEQSVERAIGRLFGMVENFEEQDGKAIVVL